jgi:hypothetical protein
MRLHRRCKAARWERDRLCNSEPIQEVVESDESPECRDEGLCFPGGSRHTPSERRSVGRMPRRRPVLPVALGISHQNRNGLGVEFPSMNTERASSKVELMLVGSQNYSPRQVGLRAGPPATKPVKGVCNF